MQAIHYPLSEQIPEVGHSIHLTPDIKWIRMPLPFALDHINLWLLSDELDGVKGWTIVDTGIANDSTKVAWNRVFETELNGLPILRIVVTHMHPDHIGLADWLTKRWSVKVWMSLGDYSVARWLVSPAGSQLGSQASGGGAADHFKLHGLSDESDLEKIRARSDYYQRMVPSVPNQFRRLMDGDVLRIGNHEWEVIAGYGHAPEHLSLWSSKQNVLISGDMVLPRISTNVSVYDSEPDANPLRLYLQSLRKFQRLHPDVLVLPSHGKPFTGLHGRLAALSEHHKERLAETMAACELKPISARELVPVLFKRELDLHQLTFAMGEAIAHLNYLWLDGCLRRELCEDRILRFSL
jgi:glyoxylase-like metal-dependent hydrolase (beta-lactamase superfamily II)